MRPPAKKLHPQPQTSRLVPPMQSSATLPVSSRRQSYQVSPILMTPRDVQPRRQSLNPTPTTSHFHIPSPLSSSSSIPPQQQRPHRIPTVAPVTNQQALPRPRPAQPDQVTDNLASIGIGMVMLDDGDESEDSCSNQPSTTSDGVRPKGLPNTSFRLNTPPGRTQPEISRNVTTLQEGVSTHSLVTQPRKASLEEMLDLPEESPPPYRTPIKEVRPNEFGRFQAIPSQPPSTSSAQGSGSSFAHSEVAPRHENAQAAFFLMQAPSRGPSVQNQPSFKRDPPRSYPPSRYSPERAGFGDDHSVHPSVSSKSSSSRSSGPPSSRHVPRRLVMPAPLAQSSAVPPQYQNRPPMAQLPPRQTRHMPHSPPFAPEPMPSAQIFVKAQAQEIHLAPSGVGKLKKRLSLIGTSHYPPVVTTVSFAPPIIGFNPVSQEDEFRNKLAHKRVLSKRRSNW